MTREFIRTHGADPMFIDLVRHLDKELADRDGNDHSFYSQFNKIDDIQYALVALIDGQPVSCGAIKPFSDDAMEVKRMYTLPAWRGKGMASAVLSQLEQWARELGYRRCVLETGKRQPEAIALYNKSGYAVTPNYGQYQGVDNSVCFEKVVTQGDEG